MARSISSAAIRQWRATGAQQAALLAASLSDRIGRWSDGWWQWGPLAHLQEQVAGWLDLKERPRPMLEVTGGLHSSARLALTGAPFSIGSSPEADIVLRDPGVAAVHARLRLQGCWARLEATGGPVALAGGPLVPEGHGCRLKLPLELVVGGARIRVVRSGKPLGQAIATRAAGLGRAYLRQPALVAASTLCAVFAVSVVAYGLPAVTSDGTTDPEGEAAIFAALPPPAGGPESATPVPRGAAGADEALRQRLAEAGIGALRIQAAEGRIAVSGTLPRRQAGAWTVIQQWFDETYGAQVPLISNVVAIDDAAMPRLPLQAIWFGERPYVLTADGSRYYEGAFVDGGWVIREIGEERLLLSKDDSTVALTYR